MEKPKAEKILQDKITHPICFSEEDEAAVLGLYPEDKMRLNAVLSKITALSDAQKKEFYVNTIKNIRLKWVHEGPYICDEVMEVALDSNKTTRDVIAQKLKYLNCRSCTETKFLKLILSEDTTIENGNRLKLLPKWLVTKYHKTKKWDDNLDYFG